jgi:hypothetical protein
VLACLLLIPGFAKAACLNVNPSFSYTPVVSAGSQATIAVSAPAGCFWEVVSQPDWIKLLSLNRGFGSGSLVFEVQPDNKNMLSPGLVRLVVRDLDTRQTRTVNLPIRATGSQLQASTSVRSVAR